MAEAHGSGADRRTGRLLVLLTGVALALRLIELDSGLWIDEIMSLLDSFRAPLAEIVTTYRHDNHHPGYSVLAHLALVAFGEAAWTIRLPAALAGAASVPLLYFLGREAVGARVGLGAAALLAVSYHHVWFSQNARGYVLLAACAILGTWLLLRLCRTPSWGLAVGFAVVTAIGAYTHLTMVFLAVGQALGLAGIVLVRRRGVGRARLGLTGGGAFVLAAALTVAAYGPALGDLIDHFLHRPSELEGVSTAGWALAEALRVLAVGFGAGMVALGALAAAGAVAIGLVGLIGLYRRDPEVAILCVAPGCTIVAGALLARGTLYPRFFFALIGVAVAIGVHGLLLTSEWAARRVGLAPASASRAGSIALGAVLLLSAASVPLNYRHPKQDFLGAMAYVDQARQGERVAVAGVTEVVYQRWQQRDWVSVGDPADLATLRRDGPVWFVWSFPRYLAHAIPGLPDLLDRECTAHRRFAGTVGGGDVHACRLEASP